MKTMNLQVNNNLKQLREKVGLTQEAAAEAIDISPSTIQNWEYGQLPRDPTLLHNLLDVYQVTDMERAKTILSLYYPENKLTKSELFQTVHEWVPDLTSPPCPNRLDLYTDTLEKLDARIVCLEHTRIFANGILSHKYCSIYNLATAKTIDKVATEYNLTLNAEVNFCISAANQECTYYFPLGDRYKMPVGESGVVMSDSEFLLSRQKVTLSDRSDDLQIGTTLPLLDRDLGKLRTLQNSILLQIANSSYFAGSVTTAYVVEKSGVLWQQIHIKPCQKTYFLPVEKSELGNIIKHKKIYRLSFSDKKQIYPYPITTLLYCDSPYISRESAEQSMRFIAPIIYIGRMKNAALPSPEEWITYCKNNTDLQNLYQKLSTVRV